MDILYLQTKKEISFPLDIKVFGQYPFYILMDNTSSLTNILKEFKEDILFYHLEKEANFPLFNYPNISYYHARIEKGAIIRDGVIIKDTAIILMGAVINKNAYIGEHTMIDMNAVIGSSAIIKNQVHISAGVVISGTMEPKSKQPVIIEDDVFIGANSVISEGIHIGKGAIIGALSFVNHDVPSYSLNYGCPSKFIRNVTKKDIEKVGLNWTLRK